VVLNTLRAGDTFGVLTLFSTRPRYPSTVVARKETKVILLAREQIITLMERCPTVSVNIITFLTERIEFLNDRVSAWTEPGVERRLAGHLLQAWEKNGREPLLINRKHTAESLGCGRASLYRALDSLSAKGILIWDDRRIVDINTHQMEEMFK